MSGGILTPKGLSLFPPWKNQQAFREFEELWEKVKIYIYDSITEYLLSIKIIAEDEKKNLSFMENFLNEDAWKMKISEEKDLTHNGSVLTKIEFKEITGSLNVVWQDRKINPSFTFSANTKEGKLELEIERIKKIIKRQKIERPPKVQIDLSSQSSRFIAYDKEQEDKQRRVISEILPLLQGNTLGFSEDEALLMVHNAMKHESFREGMRPEEIITLALKTKGKNS